MVMGSGVNRNGNGIKFNSNSSGLIVLRVHKKERRLIFQRGTCSRAREKKEKKEKKEK